MMFSASKMTSNVVVKNINKGTNCNNVYCRQVQGKNIYCWQVQGTNYDWQALDSTGSGYNPTYNTKLSLKLRSAVRT